MNFILWGVRYFCTSINIESCSASPLIHLETVWSFLAIFYALLGKTRAMLSLGRTSVPYWAGSLWLLLPIAHECQDFPLWWEQNTFPFWWGLWRLFLPILLSDSFPSSGSSLISMCWSVSTWRHKAILCRSLWLSMQLSHNSLPCKLATMASLDPQLCLLKPGRPPRFLCISPSYAMAWEVSFSSILRES